MNVERSTMRKVYWRLLPLTILVYFLCYLDRINVGFAALTMNKDLGLDAATYGMAAGAFFWGYFLFEVPSNIILEKIGARQKAPGQHDTRDPDESAGRRIIPAALPAVFIRSPGSR